MTRLEQPTETEGDEPFENFKMPYEGLASNEFIENEEPQMDESDEPNEDLSNNSISSRFENLSNYFIMKKVSSDVDNRLADHINTPF